MQKPNFAIIIVTILACVFSDFLQVTRCRASTEFDEDSKVTNTATNQSGNFGTINNSGTVNFTQTINVSIAGKAATVPISAGSVDEAVSKEELVRLLGRLASSGPFPTQVGHSASPSASDKDVLDAALQIGKGEYGPAKLLLERYRAIGILLSSDVHVDSASAKVDLTRPAAASFALARIGELEGGGSSVLDHLKEAILWSPDNLGYKLYLVSLLQRQGKTDEAAVQFGHIKGDIESTLNNMNVDVARILGDIYGGFDKIYDSIGAYQRSLAADLNSDLGVSFSKLYTLQNLAATESKIHDYENAARNFQRAVREYSNAGIDEKETVIMWNNIALMYLEAGCKELSIEWTDRVLRTLAKRADYQSLILTFVRATRGRAEFLRGDAASSDAFLRKAVDGALATFGERHWRVAQLKTYRAELALFRPLSAEAYNMLLDAAELLEELNRRPYRQYVITKSLLERARLVAGDADKPINVQNLRGYLAELPSPYSAAASWRLDLLEAEINCKFNNDRNRSVELLRAGLRNDQSGLLAEILIKHLHLPELRPAVDQLEQRYGPISALKLPPSKICLEPLLP